MEVLHKEEGNEGVFYIEQGEEIVGEMTYRRQGDDRVIVDHTEVDERLQGTGAGMLLLQSSVAFARKNSLKIVPACPYVKHVFEKTPEEYADVAA